MTHPDPAVLYPDVAARGGLAAVLEATAVELGLSIPVQAPKPQSFFRALVPSKMAHRRPLVVSASHVERRWWVSGHGTTQDLELIGGNTDGLGQVVEAAQAWHDGTSLSDIARNTPFVKLTGRFEVLGCDPAQLNESNWQHLRTEAAETDWPQYRALIEAAYREPRLRNLYAFTSHWALRFSTSTRPQLCRNIRVCLSASRSASSYAVTMGFMGDQIGSAVTAEDAVALAVQNLPMDLGPVTYGAIPD